MYVFASVGTRIHLKSLGFLQLWSSPSTPRPPTPCRRQAIIKSIKLKPWLEEPQCILLFGATLIILYSLDAWSMGTEGRNEESWRGCCQLKVDMVDKKGGGWISSLLTPCTWHLCTSTHLAAPWGMLWTETLELDKLRFKTLLPLLKNGSVKQPLKISLSH